MEAESPLLQLASESATAMQTHTSDTEDTDIEMERRPVPHTAVIEQLNAHLLKEPEYNICELLDYEMQPYDLPDSTRCGLTNLTNTCYANSLLSALARFTAHYSQLSTHCPRARCFTARSLLTAHCRSPNFTSSRW